MEKSPIRGIFTPNMVPLDAEGRINEPEFRRYIDWLIDNGVHGLYPNGSTGEFIRFTPQERRRIVEIVVDQAKGRVPVLAGAAESNARETIKACEYYHELGVRAVAIVSPIYYRLSPDNVYSYFKEIALNSPADITLYNIPLFASPIDVDTIRRLSDECERISGIKDSSGDVANMIRMIQAIRPNRPEFSFLTGWDPCLVSMMVIGCDGATYATSGIAPRFLRKMYELCTAGDWDQARPMQYLLVRLFDQLLGTADFPEAVRIAVELQGFEMGASRLPLSFEHEKILGQLRTPISKILAEMGEFHGTPPAEGVDVRRLVDTVIDALKDSMPSGKTP